MQHSSPPSSQGATMGGGRPTVHGGENEERVQTVVFLRHGIAQHNYSGANLTSPTLFDPPLVHAGKVGALEAGQKIQLWFLSTKGISSPELVISSPLTRCLQTASLAFLPGDRYSTQTNPTPTAPTTSQDHSMDPDRPAGERRVAKDAEQDVVVRATTPSLRTPIVCVEYVREAYGIHYPDRRRPLSVLKSHWSPPIQFDHRMTEQDELWSEQTRESYTQLETRIAEFLTLLCQRPETNIVVVSHGVWMETLFQRHDPQALQGPPNKDGGMTTRRVYNCNAFASHCVSSLSSSSSGKHGGGSSSFLRLENTHLI